MKHFWVWWLGLACACGHAQTNTSLFSTPPLQLRELDPETSSSSPPFTAQALQLQSPRAEPGQLFLSLQGGATAQSLFEPMELDEFSSTHSRQVYQRLEQNGYFTRPALRSENLADRALDAVFTPELVHLGKTTVSCSVYTAIKRRNPLCLLNPIFFNFSW